MNSRSRIEQQKLKLGLTLARRNADESRRAGLVIKKWVDSPSMRDLYRQLKQENVNNTAEELLIHSKNLMREFELLESALRDAETVLQQRVKYNEQTTSS